MLIEKVMKKYSLTLLGIAVLFFFLSMLRLYMIASQGYASIVTMVPDDAFYGIELGKKRNLYDFWTFDGLNETNGFHFFLPHFLWLLYKVIPTLSLGEVFLILGVLNSLVMTVALWCLMILLIRVWGLTSAIASSVPFVGSVGLTLTSLMMESSFVLLSITLSLLLVFFGNENKKWLPMTLIALGAFGVMARSDFLIIGVGLVTANFLRYGLQNGTFKRSVLVVIGSIACLLFISIKSYLETGLPTQGSSQIKFYYSSVVGHSLKTPVLLLLDTLVPDIAVPDRIGSIINSTLLGNSLLFAVSALLVIVLFLIIAFQKGQYKLSLKGKKSVHLNQITTTSQPPLIVFALCSLLFLFVVYYFNSQGMQIWYTANFLTQASILWAAVFGFLSSIRVRTSALLSCVALLLSSYDGSVSVNSPIWPHGVGMMKAGLEIRAIPGEKFGSWNSGMIGYFSNKKVVNLDGLVNNSVIPYIEDGKLLEYLNTENIRFIVDYEVMLTEPKYKKRGGYADDQLRTCASRIKRLDEAMPSFQDSHLYLFELNKKCT